MNSLLKRVLLGLTMAVGAHLLFGGLTASAAQMQTPKPQVYIEGYEVTNESIMPGTEFTLTIKLKNYSPEAVAEEVIVSVTNPDGIIPEYGTVSMVYLDKIEPDTSAEVKFNYVANTDIKKTELNFNVTVSNSYNASGAQIRIPVGRLTDFEVEKSTIPENVTVKKTSYASVMVENISDDTYYNVSMVARCDGKDIATAQMGSIAAGKTKTQSLGLVFDAEGMYSVDFLLTYINAEGENKEYLISSNEIKVTENVSSIITPEQQGEQSKSDEKEGDSQSSIIIICISGILLIAICCLALMFVYRRK